MENISKRLMSAANLAENSTTVADIGTDHAYLPIYLLEQGKAAFAICCDVNKGPLRRAEKNIKARNLESKTSLRLGNGLSPLKKGEADTIFICGMGGLNIISLLSEGISLALSAKTLIIQPQNDIPKVRKYLTEKGFSIEREKMVFEGGFFYTILAVKPGKSLPLTAEESLLGPCLLRENPPVFKEYLDYRINKLTALISELEHKNSPAAGERSAEIRKELSILKEVRQNAR